jgi:hypothetical protein
MIYFLLKKAKRVKILFMDNFIFLKSPDRVKTEIAGRMRERRKEKKLSQVQLSERSDVSLGSLKRFERTGEISLSSFERFFVKIADSGEGYKKKMSKWCRQ